jgi:single-strand DNA-binding protein
MGRLTRDPETRYSQAAEPVAIVRFGIAVSRRFKQPNEPDVDFFDCVAFRKTGEFIGKYFNKGRMIAVTGQLRNNNWEDQSGQKRFKTEVIVDDAFFTESKSAAEASGFNTQSQNTSQPPQSNQNQSFYSIDQNIDDEDLPF